MNPSDGDSFVAYGEGNSLITNTQDCVSSSIVVPESISEMIHPERSFPAVVASGGTLNLRQVLGRPDALEVIWTVSRANPNDNIRLYVHNRFHDENYLYSIPTEGKSEGSHTFPGLVRGFYDVRFFRGASAVHASDIVVAVCCLGPVVPLEVTIGHPPDRLMTVCVSARDVQLPSDWLALFPADEHSNRYHRCSACALVSQAKSEGGNVVFRLPMPRIPGNYELRYFFGNSQSIKNGNAFSGRALVVIPCEDALSATYELETKRCTISWKVYSVAPNNWQWIGLYDKKGNCLTYEYVSKHIYTAKSHEEGVVLLKNIPKELEDWSATSVMPAVVREWRLRFYNTYFSAMLTAPVIDVPFISQ